MNKHRIYITGPVRGRDTQQLNEFRLAQEKLINLGFQDVTTAIDDLPMGDAFNTPDAQAHYELKRIEKINAAEVVLYLNDYDQDQTAIDEVRIARHTDKVAVMNANSFIIQYTSKAAIHLAAEPIQSN